MLLSSCSTAAGGAKADDKSTIVASDDDDVEACASTSSCRNMNQLRLSCQHTNTVRQRVRQRDVEETVRRRHFLRIVRRYEYNRPAELHRSIPRTRHGIRIIPSFA
ncbi:hypothetical protein QE152_g38414 [Popillia japonica]|uniref:Secreted protein n=1 Tax=Popillia japonica TaxID=7064 RepID=A0AAW1HXX2_POPJA